MAKNRINVRVRDRDRGWRKLRKEVRAPTKHVTVGVHGEDDSRAGGIGNVELMAVHEFGSVRAGIPERSVIRLTIDDNLNKYRSLIRELGSQIYRVRITADQALELLGLRVASDMRNTINRTPGVWPALKDATLAARQHGGTKPLLDRAELQRSIKHRVSA